MLKFQLHSDLINPWPKKFVQKLEIKDSNQGFCEGVGKKTAMHRKKNHKDRVFLNTPHGKPAAHGLIRWLVTVKSFPFFQAGNPPDTDYESAEELRLAGRKVGGQVTGGWSVD